MKFIEFLELLSNDKLIPNFSQKLVTQPNQVDDPYFSIGSRWCTVERLLGEDQKTLDDLMSFAFRRRDPDFSFSACNLKAQYIPDEDFVDMGCAYIMFALVGTTWHHTVRVTNQLELFKKLCC